MNANKINWAALFDAFEGDETPLCGFIENALKEDDEMKEINERAEKMSAELRKAGLQDWCVENLMVDYSVLCMHYSCSTGFMLNQRYTLNDPRARAAMEALWAYFQEACVIANPPYMPKQG